MPAPKVAILGAGVMGSSVARVLKSHGVEVRLYVRSARRAESLHDLADAIVTTPLCAASGAELVLSCVSDDAAAEAVWFGEEGACSSELPPSVCVEMSTLSVDFTDRWVSKLTACGHQAIDCPVTGSRKAAESGTLVAFVGAPAHSVPALDRFLSIVSKKAIYFERAGSAMRFKLCYNTIGAAICAAFAEGLAAMETSGVDLELALAALEEGGWTSAVAKSKGRMMIERRYEPTSFRCALMLKDLECAQLSQEAFGLHRPIAEVVHTLYARVRDGWGDVDFSAIREAFSVTGHDPP